MTRHSLFLFSILFVLSAVFPSSAQLYEEALPPELRTNGKSTLKEIDSQREILQKTSAVILSGQTPIANGTVMTSDGYLLTKASSLQGIKEISVRIDRTLYKKVTLLDEDPATDLLLLKIEATDLPLPVWGDPPAIGTVVIANGASTRANRRAKLGIISADTRAISSQRSIVPIGIAFSPYRGTKVTLVYPGYLADNAGVKPDDELLTINHKALKYPEDAPSLLLGFKKNDTVPLSVRRDGKEINLSGTVVLPPADRNDMMSGRFNARRDNFPDCIQHDIPLSIYNSGGPLITLEGKTVGINIARANRAESFALTSKVVKETFAKLLKKAVKKSPPASS